jgi:hypothetical protein
VKTQRNYILSAVIKSLRSGAFGRVDASATAPQVAEVGNSTCDKGLTPPPGPVGPRNLRPIDIGGFLSILGGGGGVVFGLQKRKN